MQYTNVSKHFTKIYCLIPRKTQETKKRGCLLSLKTRQQNLDYIWSQQLRCLTLNFVLFTSINYNSQLQLLKAVISFFSVPIIRKHHSVGHQQTYRRDTQQLCKETGSLMFVTVRYVYLAWV